MLLDVPDEWLGRSSSGTEIDKKALESSLLEFCFSALRFVVI